MVIAQSPVDPDQGTTGISELSLSTSRYRTGLMMGRGLSGRQFRDPMHQAESQLVLPCPS